MEGLHREFLRAGSDVMQAFTYYASDDKLEHRGNTAGAKYTGRGINLAAAEIAKKVAAEGDALVLGGISQCPSYLDHLGKAKVQHEFRKQVRVFVEAGLDFLLCEVNCQIYIFEKKIIFSCLNSLLYPFYFFQFIFSILNILKKWNGPFKFVKRQICQ